MYNGATWDTVPNAVRPHPEPTCTHPVPEHIGGVPPTVLVVLLAAAIRNHFLLEGIVPVGVRDDAAALPLRSKRTGATQALLQVYWEF